MTRSRPISEPDLGAQVVSWLETDGWDVYQEVEPARSGNRCDIVAVSGPLTWAIECKTALSLQVIGQAYHWRRYANFSSVAVPAAAKSSQEFAKLVLTTFGLGMIAVDDDGAMQVVHPRLRRRVSPRLREALRPEHKVCAKAGMNGWHYTPLQAAKDALRRYVAEHDGVTVKDAMAAIRHHYATAASARGAMVQNVDLGVVPGVRLTRNKGEPMRFWATPFDEEKAQRERLLEIQAHLLARREKRRGA